MTAGEKIVSQCAENGYYDDELWRQIESILGDLLKILAPVSDDPQVV